jgi:hypothetical protein
VANVVTSLIGGGPIGKLVSKYFWRVDKAYALGKRIVGLGKKLWSGFKDWKKSKKVAEAAEEVASCAVKNSFTPETRVVLADGSTKKIKDVDIGDKVLATDPETGGTKAETVTAEIKGKGLKHLVKVTVDTDGKRGSKTSSVTATDGHPFWVPELGQWIDATDLQAGERLRTSAGTRVEITAIKRWTVPSATVHNLTVGEFHTYYVLAGATPILVHNANKCVSVNDAGRFGDLNPGQVGDGLEAHHMPQDGLGFLSRNEGGAIVIAQGDHALTRTYKSLGRATKAAESGLPFRTVLARDIWDLRRIGQRQYGNPGYFNPGIQGLLGYYRKIGML